MCYRFQWIKMCVLWMHWCTDTAQSDVGSSCFFTLPGANSDRPVDFFRILRVAYVSSSAKHSSLTAGDLAAKRRRGSAASTTGASSALGAFTYETFTPELVSRYSATLDVVERLDVIDRIETMNETFAKVIAFLQNSGSSVYTHSVSHYIHLYFVVKTAMQKQIIFNNVRWFYWHWKTVSMF